MKVAKHVITAKCVSRFLRPIALKFNVPSSYMVHGKFLYGLHVGILSVALVTKTGNKYHYLVANLLTNRNVNQDVHLYHT